MTSQVRFPNGMVDRITPQTTDADRAELSRRFGIDDAWPVLCEPFTQWVLEENFTDGQPPLEDVGVQIVSDVEPYELMKLRLLNASHQALCYPGYLVGYRLVHDVTTDPLFARFLLEYMTQEAIPTLRPVPGIDLQHYARELIERFSRFTRVYTSIMTSIREHGVRRTLADLDRYATSSMADREPAGLERKSP
jgi:mannitol 2-dehydrogenase